MYFNISASGAEAASKSPISKQCERHRKFYKYSCRRCSEEQKKQELLKKLPELRLIEQVNKEVEICSSKNRSKEISLRRAFLIKELKDVLKYNNTEIAKMLKRHRTTISYLYKYAKNTKLN
ncbi:MAG: hypothetical protein AABY22_02630 [Nanoarchaeota archaeon]